MSSDPIDVLRELVAKWRQQEVHHDVAQDEQDSAEARSEWHAGMSQAYSECAESVESALASLSAPKPDAWSRIHEAPEYAAALAEVDAQIAGKPESAEAVGDRQAWYESELAKAERQWIDGFSRRYEAGDDVPSMSSFVALWLAERTTPPRPEASDADFLRHIASVCRGAFDLCEPKPQRTPEDDREHNGGLCLTELANIANEIERRLAAPQQASAPVGVGDLSCCGGNDETPKSHCMDCSRYPGQLAQQPAALSWDDGSGRIRDWRGQPAPVAPVGVEGWNPKMPPLIGTLADLKDYEKPAVEAYGRACARAGRDAALAQQQGGPQE